MGEPSRVLGGDWRQGAAWGMEGGKRGQDEEPSRDPGEDLRGHPNGEDLESPPGPSPDTGVFQLGEVNVRETPDRARRKPDREVQEATAPSWGRALVLWLP